MSERDIFSETTTVLLLLPQLGVSPGFLRRLCEEGDPFFLTFSSATAQCEEQGEGELVDEEQGKCEWKEELAKTADEEQKRKSLPISLPSG